jgi:large subunit ribosomal protein L3
MPLGLLGLKVGMTQVYDDRGKIAPVTVLQVGPCPVLQVKKKDGLDQYDAVQIGFLDKKRSRATRAERGHVSADLESKRRQAGGKPLAPKANTEPQRFIREFRLEGPPTVEVGAILTAADVFPKVKKQVHGKEVEAYPSVDIIGTSKGRGFTGAMKRHNFQGLPASHGAKKVHRSAGSIGSHASNRGSGRPKKGHKGAGRYGGTRSTVRNLQVVRIDADNHLVLVRGAVPGPNGGLVMIRPTNKKG